jgi:uncharacterized protein YciI
MPYLVLTKDRPDYGHIRSAIKPSHIEYLEANKASLLAAGALLDDGAVDYDGTVLLDTDDAGEADAFIADDPYSHAGLYAQVTLVPWRKEFFNFDK